MESKKQFLCIIILLSLWVFVSFGEEKEGKVSADLPCMEKLLPCQPYLKSPSPPPTCCIPLKEMVADDIRCLCAIFNNTDILKGLNITQDEALQLPKSCGANADINRCKGAIPPAPTAPANGSSTGNNTSKNSATGVAVMGGYGFIAVSIPVLISAVL